MSKIQEALRQMQLAKQQQADSAAVAEDPQRLATVTRKALTDADIERLEKESSPARSAKLTHFAEIDRQALRDAGLIAPEQEERVLADEYRQIKRPLIANAFGKRANKVEDGRLIVVASALPGDGKTFTCINLAISMAQEKDRSVVLVDADVAKPHISNLFNLEKHKGLLDLIEDKSLNVNDLLVRTDVERLTLLPSGHTRLQATELLASDQMERLIHSLIDADPNRIVLFDSPPLLVTSESRVLASLMGQVVLVVKAGVTPQSAVEAAISNLDLKKAVNLVLNQARGKDRHGFWGSYYGYGTPYGVEPQEPAEGEKSNENN